MSPPADNRILESLFGGRARGYLNLWSKKRKSVSDWINLAAPGAVDQAVRKAKQLDEAGYDVYFGVCPGVAARGEHERCRKQDVLYLPAYFLDIDTLLDSGKAGKRIPEDLLHAQALLEALPCPPSECVASGHGLHAYWILEEPVPVQGAHEAADARLRRFADTVALAMDCPGLDRHASEICRVLRVPGTHNHKGGGALPVESVKADGPRYDVRALDSFAAERRPSGAAKASTAAARPAKPAPVRRCPAPVGARGGDYAPGGRYYLTDAQILDGIGRSKRFADCIALLNGGNGQCSSASEADLRLCNAFAFFTGGDAARVDRLFRGSRRYRDKWDQRHGKHTYGEMTAEKACADTATFYRGRDFKLDRLDPAQLTRFERVAAAYEHASGGGYKATPFAVNMAKRDRDGNEILEPLADFVPEPVETIQRDDGAEVTSEYVLEGWNYCGARLPKVTVQTAKIKTFQWVLDSWPGAVLEPGQQKADKLRAAIQKASRELAPSRIVYTHSGWRQLNGKYVYLYNGGAVGTEGVSVELDGKLSRYALPEAPTDRGALREAARASLGLLNLAPWPATAPLLVSMYLAPLCEFFALAGERVSHLMIVRGKTQTKKSTLTALMLSHFGAGFTYNSLPLNFQSTANAICAQMFQMKDVPAVVDDFHPTTSERRGSLDEMTRIARRISRAVADDAGRARLESDGKSLHADRPARGLVLVTAEFEPDLGESGDSRCFIAALNPGDVRPSAALDEAQEAARRGVYATAMRGFIEWLCGRVNAPGGAEALAGELRIRFQEHRRQLNEEHRGLAAHGRLGTACAHLLTALDVLIDFCRTVDCVDAGTEESLRLRARAAIVGDVLRHAADVCGSDPIKLFAGALQEMLSDPSLLPSAEPLIHCGEDAIGYQTEDRLYLKPKKAMGRVLRMCQDSGSPLGVSGKEIWRRLDEAGAVEPVYTRGQRAIAGTQRVKMLAKPVYCVQLLRDKLERLAETSTEEEAREE